jgi:hypothetical protein
MSRMERWSLHLAALLTAGTGLLDGGLRWFGERMGEFGPEPSPYLGLAQHLHVLVAPGLVFTLGLLVRGHLWPMFKGSPQGRRTGMIAALLIAPMILTGSCVQVATSPAWRMAFAWGHGLSASAFLLAYGAHLVRAWVAPYARTANQPATQPR